MIGRLKIGRFNLQPSNLQSSNFPIFNLQSSTPSLLVAYTPGVIGSLFRPGDGRSAAAGQQVGRVRCQAASDGFVRTRVGFGANALVGIPPVTAGDCDARGIAGRFTSTQASVGTPQRLSSLRSRRRSYRRRYIRLRADWRGPSNTTAAKRGLPGVGLR